MLVVISAFLAGAAVVIVIELFFIYRWFQAQPHEEPKLFVPSYIPVTNPQDIAQYCGIEDATESETCMFLNLIFQFLWKEWRDSPKTRNFFIRRMNLEFQEMLLNKAAGKLMEQITVRDYHLGDSLPVIKKATVMKIDTRNPTNVPREIDIALDIEYSGGFIISLDVDLIFGKSTHFTVKLNSLKGRLRLQFTRIPCTHWSFSFYEDPIMDLEVESNFQGRNLPKLTSFIHNQIHRAIKKKHTFPRYKVRYKPFFIQEKPQDGKNEVFVHSSLLTVGRLDVEVVECTRLVALPRGSHIYCSLSLDSLPWKEDMPLRRSLWPVHEVLICRSPSGAIGVSFYREFEVIDEDKHEIILIKTVSPNSPASKVDIQRGDILLSVNNVDIISMKQAARLVKNAGNKFTFKLQRPPIINDEHGRMNENEIFEKAVPESLSYGDEVQESFDYNSISLQDDDSENEEFVNIVLLEIGEELIPDDSRVKQFFEKKIKHFERTSSDQTIIRSDDAISLSAQDVSHFTSKRNCSIDIQNFKTESLRSSLDSHKGEFDTSLAPKLGGKKEEKTSKMRTFSFFKRNKTDNNSVKSNYSMRSSSGYTTDISDNLTEANSYINGNSSDTELNKRTFAPDMKKKKQVKLVEEKQFNGALSNHIYEPLGVNASFDNYNQSADCEWDNISQHNLENTIDVAPDDDKESMGQKTTLVNANEEPVFNEIFTFDIEKEHKYMSICVWGKCEESFDKDVLLGYVSIPLIDLAVECLSTSSRKSIQTFSLATTSNRSTIVNRSLLRTMMPGLNTNCCNGDITLAFKYVSSVPECDLESEEIKLYADQLKKKNELVENKDDKDYMEDIPKEHNFVAGEFYFPTLCDYCQNKVWRKIAFQCAVCTMVCHKRCIQNAQANTYCTAEGVRAKPPAWQTNGCNENINETPVDSQLTLTPEDPPNSFRPLSLPIPDENDLRPGIKHVGSSPNLLRRRNIKAINEETNNHFNDVIMEAGEDKERDYITTAAVTAKEAGRELFASLDESSRESNIQGKVEKLQNEINIENEQGSSLRDQLSVCKNAERAQKIQMQMRKSEERNQALALLMIQYCAALKECLTMDEPQQCDL